MVVAEGHRATGAPGIWLEMQPALCVWLGGFSLVLSRKKKKQTALW